jgi:very-short-patch-repair endonuclease
MTIADDFEEYLKIEAAKLWADDQLWDSPIEKALGCALFAMITRELAPAFVFRGGTDDRVDTVMRYMHTRLDGQNFVLIFTQQPIDRYRVDMVLLARLGTTDAIHRMIIECDGHAFHEKTKEQAARDKRRDRDLSKHDLKTLRFTGSEIHKNPFDCALEVVSHLARAA